MSNPRIYALPISAEGELLRDSSGRTLLFVGRGYIEAFRVLREYERIQAHKKFGKFIDPRAGTDSLPLTEDVTSELKSKSFQGEYVFVSNKTLASVSV